MKFRWYPFLILLASVYLVSCSTSKTLPIILENVVDTTGKEPVIVQELKIQKNDLLSIQVYSLSTDPKADEYYNLVMNQQMGGGGSNSAMLSGFLVDYNGNIEYPRLGTIHAEGLTKTELANEIKKRLTQPVELLRSPSVIIRFMNYKILVMGEVSGPGPITVPGERITILEAIGMAGGITTGGKKEYVKVLRETNGQREIGIIDLSSKDLFKSPYYNLVQNDIIIVEPTRRKRTTEEQSVVSQRITFALSLITAAAFIYNIFSTN